MATAGDAAQLTGGRSWAALGTLMNMTKLKTIRRGAPKAKLIWANTTPLKSSPTNAPPRQAADARIAARNDIALRFVQASQIPVDDLYSIAFGHPEYHSDNVHFNDRGIALQAAQVADGIAEVLKPLKIF